MYTMKQRRASKVSPAKTRTAGPSKTSMLARPALISTTVFPILGPPGDLFSNPPPEGGLLQGAD